MWPVAVVFRDVVLSVIVIMSCFRSSYKYVFVITLLRAGHDVFL